VTALEVVVSIQGTRVSVPRPYVELRATPPAEWSVVRNPKVKPERTPQGLRQRYIVCPSCRRRVEMPASRLAEQLCPHCNETFPIAWDDRPRKQP
jgi:predicted RNA-binding Zn-ribbon protein involved in translation (DUF1610 family)